MSSPDIVMQETLMRLWHKRIVPFFVIFMLLLAITGLAIQATDILDHKQHKRLFLELKNKPWIMLHKGVIVRSMKAYGYPDFIRITVGTKEENERFIASLGECLRELQYV